MNNVPGFFGNGPDYDEVPGSLSEDALLMLEGRMKSDSLTYSVAEVIEALTNANDALEAVQAGTRKLHMDERQALRNLTTIAGYLSRRHADLIENLKESLS